MIRSAAIGWNRLALRIYLVSAAALLAVGAALYVLVTVVWRPPPHGGPLVDMARYAMPHVAARWTSPRSLEAELAAMRAELHLVASAYRWDGALVTSTAREPLPRLDDAERVSLLTSSLIERGGTCERDRCQLAFAVGEAGAMPVGYLVVERAGRHLRPPPMNILPPILAVVALGVAAALLGRNIARPLDRLAATAQAFGGGDLKARTGLVRRDELGAVARAFDDMADRVEKLVVAQTELIANVAHELRTPLARIRLALELAESGDAAARESLVEIAQDLAELEGLVNDILAAARLDLGRSTAATGAPPLRVVELEVASVVRDAAERIRHRHPDRRIETSVEPGIPAIVADAVLLRRALDNLLDNARKYSRPDAPIRVSAVRRGGGVAIEVVDSGEGIPATDLERVFTPFFRGDRSRTRSTGGVGLGLSLTRRIVEAHGGTITAASTPNVGTTMTVTLPSAPAES